MTEDQKPKKRTKRGDREKKTKRRSSAKITSITVLFPGHLSSLTTITTIFIYLSPLFLLSGKGCTKK